MTKTVTLNVTPDVAKALCSALTCAISAADCRAMGDEANAKKWDKWGLNALKDVTPHLDWCHLEGLWDAVPMAEAVAA